MDAKFSDLLSLDIHFIRATMLTGIDLNIGPIRDDYIATIIAITILENNYNDAKFTLNKDSVLIFANNST